MLDRANSGPAPDAAILRAIRHGVAAGACRVAAEATGKAGWKAKAEAMHHAAAADLHHAASARRAAWACARSSRLTPKPFSFEKAAISAQYSPGID